MFLINKDNEVAWKLHDHDMMHVHCVMSKSACILFANVFNTGLQTYTRIYRDWM